MKTTDPGRELEVLDETECWGLISRDTLGRIAYTHRAMPAIRPVNYVLSGHDVLIRTAPSSEMGRSLDGQVVALEVDQIDRSTRSGWVVVITGTATATDLTGQPPRPSLAGLEPWAAGERGLLVHIDVNKITGRRLVAPEAVPEPRESTG